MKLSRLGGETFVCFLTLTLTLSLSHSLARSISLFLSRKVFQSENENGAWESSKGKSKSGLQDDEKKLGYCPAIDIWWAVILAQVAEFWLRNGRMRVRALSEQKRVFSSFTSFNLNDAMFFFGQKRIKLNFVSSTSLSTRFPSARPACLHFRTDWLSRLRLSNQVGSTTDHLANCYLPSTPEDQSTMTAELTE